LHARLSLERALRCLNLPPLRNGKDSVINNKALAAYDQQTNPNCGEERSPHQFIPS
jgi:hypothetical protein